MNYNTITRREHVTLNHENQKAYETTPEMELYMAVATCMLDDKYYEKKEDIIKRIAWLIEECRPEFVAKLAVYARTKMNLRSIPFLLLVELSRKHNGDGLVGKATAKAIQRADEICELLMCYEWRNASKNAKKLGKLPNQLRLGLKEAFNKFDEYAFGKYNDPRAEVTLRDALFITHPKAKDMRQQELFDKIAEKRLATPYTWETEFSELGKRTFETEDEKKRAFKEKWEEMIESGKMGYMATLRNLCNMIKYGIGEEHIDRVCSILGDRDSVRRSRQFPFRFLAAYREIGNGMPTNDNTIKRLQETLEKAMLYSIESIDGFDENTRVLIASDVSGSMSVPVSRNSTIRNIDVGILLSMMLKNKCEKAIGGIFGDTWLPLDIPANNILGATNYIKSIANSVGYSTNGHLVIDWLIGMNMRVDRVMMFTDCELWDSTRNKCSLEKSWNRYKMIAPEAKLVLFNLAGSRNMPLRLERKDVICIAGWNEKIFTAIEKIEREGGEMVNEIMREEL